YLPTVACRPASSLTCGSMWMMPSSWLCSPAYTAVLPARDGDPCEFAFGQFQMPSPLPSLNQWSQSYTPSAACQCVCRLCGSLLFEAFAMYGPSLAGCVMRAYTTSATPTMRMRAVSPYHQLLLRARFADRTAARLRFFGVAFAIEREDYPRVRG